MKCRGKSLTWLEYLIPCRLSLPLYVIYILHFQLMFRATVISMQNATAAMKEPKSVYANWDLSEMASAVKVCYSHLIAFYNLCFHGGREVGRAQGFEQT